MTAYPNSLLPVAAKPGTSCSAFFSERQSDDSHLTKKSFQLSSEAHSTWMLHMLHSSRKQLSLLTHSTWYDQLGSSTDRPRYAVSKKLATTQDHSHMHVCVPLLKTYGKTCCRCQT